MKIILTKHVPKLGNPCDIVSVAPGYGRNFLIAKGLAKEASEQAIKELNNKKEKKEKQSQIRDEKFQRIRKALEGKEILVRAVANEEGHLFGGVGAKEIVDAILKRKKIEINEKSIDLAHRLKKIGKHEVSLKIGGETVKFFVDIQQ